MTRDGGMVPNLTVWGSRVGGEGSVQVGRTALITGITGQDGSYLAESLLTKGYEVHGVVRPTSVPTTVRIEQLITAEVRPGRLTLHQGDVQDGRTLAQLIRELEPDEVYNLAAQSHVGASFVSPEQAMLVGGVSVVPMLEAIRDSGREVRFYQAGSSEMFGNAAPPQSELTAFEPRSPYAAAKVYAHSMVRIYREAYGLFAVTGILFNHESPRRGPGFVTRKTTIGVARIAAGQQDMLELGNLDARRDWGHAAEYVEAMHAMLQLDEPEDLAIGTGVTHSVRELVEFAFGLVGLDWRDHVRVSDSHMRPTEVHHLRADASRAAAVLGWKPESTFEDLIREMLEADLAAQGLSLAEARLWGAS